MIERKREVAFLLSKLNRGGAETLMLDIFKREKNADFEFIGIHCKDGTLRSEFENTKPEFIHCKIDYPFDIRFLLRLRKIVKQKKITHIHAQHYLYALYAKIACIGLSTKILLTFHGFDFLERGVNRGVMQQAINGCNDICFVSNYQRQEYEKLFTFRKNINLHTIYNGIDFEKLDCQKLLHKTLPKCNDFQDRVKMGMVGNFVGVRDHFTVCKFLKELKDRNIKFNFYFAGNRSIANPELYDACVNYCRENNIQESVHFLGGREDVPQILRELDAFVYSTNHDTFGIALLEAIALELPTFANDWEVMKEVTENGKLATLYKTKDENDLLEKILLFLQNREQYEITAKANATTVREKYSIENHIKKLSKLYT